MEKTNFAYCVMVNEENITVVTTNATYILPGVMEAEITVYVDSGKGSCLT